MKNPFVEYQVIDHVRYPVARPWLSVILHPFFYIWAQFLLWMHLKR